MALLYLRPIFAELERLELFIRMFWIQNSVLSSLFDSTIPW